MKNTLKGIILFCSLIGMVACSNNIDEANKTDAEEQESSNVSARQAAVDKKDSRKNVKNEAIENGSGGVALEVPGRADLSALVAETEFIVIAEMTNDYEVTSTPITGENSVYMIENEYQATIKEVHKGSSKVQLQKGDSINLIVPVGMQQRLAGKEEGGVIPLFDNLPEIQKGEYLLFLEKIPKRSAHVTTFTPSNMNHIYREVGDEYQNIVSDMIPVVKKDATF